MTMELVDQLAERYSEWENVEFGTIAVVIEVSGTPPESERDPDWEPEPGKEDEVYTTSVMSYRCTDPRRWIQEAFFRMAYKAAKQ